MLVIKKWPITTVLAGPVFPDRGGCVISIPRKSALCVRARVLALFSWGCGGLIRTPDRSLFHLQIGFLYRSAPVIHFPTGSDQYSLTRLKVRETDKTLVPIGRLTAPPSQRPFPKVACHPPTASAWSELWPEAVTILFTLIP